MLNACREDSRRFLSHTTFEDTPSVASSPLQPLPCTSNPGIPTIAKEVLAGSVVPPDIGGECPVRLARTFAAENAVHVAGASSSTSTTRLLTFAVLRQLVF